MRYHVLNELVKQVCVVTMTENQNPEQKARDIIDALLRQAGWVVQSAKKIDLNVGLGQAVREYQTDVGPADLIRSETVNSKWKNK